MNPPHEHAAPFLIGLEGWRLIADTLEKSGREWPPPLADRDLDFMAATLAAGAAIEIRPGKWIRRMPGRPALRRRWNWTDHAIQQHLKARTTPPGTWPTVDRQSFNRVTLEILGGCAAIQQTSNTNPPDTTGQPLGGAGASPPAAASTDRNNTVNHQKYDRPGQAIPGTSANIQQPIASSADRKTPSEPVAPLIDPSLNKDQTSSLDKESGAPETRSPLPEESAEFLRVFRRFSGPAAPAARRWATSSTEALDWFTTEILGDATGWAGVDVVGQLRRWEDWLCSKAESYGKPGTSSGAKFPKNWKNSLRNWLTRERDGWRASRGSGQTKHGDQRHEHRQAGPARRGGFGDAEQQFAPPPITDSAGFDEWE